MASRQKIEAMRVEISGDISGLKKAMNDAVADFKNAEYAIKELNKAIKADPNDKSLLEARAEAEKKAIEEGTKALRRLYLLRTRITNDPNYKNGVTELTKEYSALTAKIKEQIKVNNDLKNAYKATQQEIRNFEINKKFEALNEQLKKSKELIDRIKQASRNVDAQIKIAPDDMSLYQKKYELLGDEIRVTTKAIENLEKKQKDLVNTPGFMEKVHGYTEEYTQMEVEIQKLREELVRLKAEYNVSPGMMAFHEQITSLGDIMLDVANRTSRFSRVFQGLMATAFNSAVEYESNIAGIKKIVGELSDDTIADLKDIAIETGNAFSEIADYATIGGALGLTERELSNFTKTMVDLNTATGGVFTGEEGAKGIAVFLKQLGLGIEQAENFGSAIAEIGDKYADIGDETVNVATRLTALTAIVDTNQYELLGLAGVMADLGLSADSNANAINRAFLQIEKIIADTSDKGSDKMKELASASGMTVKEFKKQWGEDAVETFLRFTDGLKSSFFNEVNDAIAKSSKNIQDYAEVLGWSADYFVQKWGEDSKGVFDMYVDKLGEMGDEAESASVILKDLGISSVNTAQTLLRLSGSGNEVREAIELANRAWNENTALAEKSGIIYDTTERKIESFKESWRQLTASITDSVLPTIKGMMDMLTNLFTSLSNADPIVKNLALSFTVVAASISPFARGLGTLDKFLGRLTSPSFGLPHLVKLLTSPTGMIQGIILLTGALLTGTVAFGEYLKKVETSNKGLIKLRDTITGTREDFESATQSLKNSLVEVDYQISKESLSVYENINHIKELTAKLKELKPTEDEYKKTKEELTDKINELNGALGTSYYYDSKKKEILDENKDVADLTTKYEELLLAKRKAMYLEETAGTYNKALQDEATALQTIADAKWEYAQATKGYNDEIVAFAQHMATNASDIEVMSMFNEMDSATQRAVLEIADLYIKASETVDQAKILAQESGEIISQVDAVTNATGDDLEHLLDVIKNGWNIDPAKNDLDALYSQLEKVQFLLANPEGLSMENLMQLEGMQEEIQKQIEAVEIAKQKAEEVSEVHGKLFDEIGQGLENQKTKYNEIYNTDTDSILNTTTMSWDSIKETIGSASSEIFDDYKTKGQTANEELQAYFDANPLRQTVLVNRVLAGDVGGNGQNYYPTIQSAGFGDLLKTSMASIRNSIPSIQYASGGFSSGGIVLNANFNVNANNVDRAQVKSWSRWIVDDLNEALGKQI